MSKVDADGAEDVERAGMAALRQLLHLFELFRRRQAFCQRNASRRSQLYDRVLREIFAADAEIARQK